jgi:hypothetical protein
VPEPRAFDFDQIESPSSPVRLRRVPLPLNGNERYQWRLTSVLVALAACRGKSSTVEQLHTLVWAINDPINAERFESAWHGAGTSRGVRGYVTGLLDTLRVAQVEGLVEQAANGRQKLSPRGVEVVDAFRDSGGSLGKGDIAITSLAPISSADMWRRLGEGR